MLVRCLEDRDYEDLKLYVGRVAAVMIEYEWLINAKLIDFYIDSSWSRLASSWQDYLSELNTDHLAQWLNNEPVTVRKVMPLSLQCFRRVAQQCAFARQESNLNELNRLVDSLPGDQLSATSTANGQPDTNAHRTDDDGNQSSTQSYKITELNRIDLKDIFTKNLKIKKQHEVGRFSSLIASALDPKSVQLIDFGSGRGHLARFLSLYFGFQVTTLELEESTSKRAAELDLQAIRHCQNKKLDEPRATGSLPKHLNVRVTSDFELNLEGSGSTKKAAIGLHACGTLSRNILELFKDGFADYLLLVSCCYHLDDSADGFLLSKAANHSLTNYRNLNHETKEIACHSVEQSIEQLKGKTNRPAH